MEAKYLLVSVSLILSSAVISIDNIENIYSNKNNTLYLENGKVFLGKVYEERVNTDFEVINKSDSSTLMSVSAPTKDIFKKSDEYMRSEVDAINKDGGFPDKDGKKRKLDYQTISWTTDVIVKKTTTVTYRSEYTNTFVLTIDASEETIPASAKTVVDALQSLQYYSQKMLNEYELHNSFIK